MLPVHRLPRGSGALRPRRRGLLVPLLLGVGTFCICSVNVLILASRFAAVEEPAVVELPPSPPHPPPPPMPPVSPLLRIGRPAADTIHVCVSSSSPDPQGIFAVINSTIMHNFHSVTLFFHLVVPTEQHELYTGLETIFPGARFGVFGMAANGVEQKIRHRLLALRTGAGAGRLIAEAAAESSSKHNIDHEVEASLFPWAVTYLPALFPRLRRLIWLEPDVLVLRDLLPLWQLPLHGLPVAAAPDCTRRLQSMVNVSLMSSVALRDWNPQECSLNLGVLLVDLVQWAALDFTSRIEYWTKQYSRTPMLLGELYQDALSPVVPFTLAAQQMYSPLEREWNFFGLGNERFDRDALAHWKRVWTREKIKDPYQFSAAPVRVLEEPLQGRILQFSGPQKPWLPASGPGAMCMQNGTLHSCASLWFVFAQNARVALRVDFHAARHSQRKQSADKHAS